MPVAIPNGTADVEVGQQPAQQGSKQRRPSATSKAWCSVARPLPALDSSGLGWYGIIVSLLSTVVLIILADKANNLTTQLNNSSRTIGLNLLAKHDPTAICINGSMAERTDGTWSRAMLMCAEPDKDHLGLDAYPHEWPLTGSLAVKDILSNLLAVVAGLESCRAIQGYYVLQDILNSLDPATHKGQASSLRAQQSNGDNSPSTDLYRKVKEPDAAHIQTVISVLHAEPRAIAELYKAAMHPSYNVTSPSGALLRLVGSEYTAVLRAGQRAGYDIESRLYMPSEAPRVNRSSNLSWKGRDLVMRVVGKNWPASALWLHLHQDDSTAQCLLRFVRSQLPGAQKTLVNCTNAFLGPNEQVNYNCFEGVEGTAMQQADRFITMAKRNNKVNSFLFMKALNADDVYAIYTAALGSVFAAVAVAAATVVLVVVVILWRAIF